jgi:hypothetical protein
MHQVHLAHAYHQPSAGMSAQTAASYHSLWITNDIANAMDALASAYYASVAWNALPAV